MAGPAKPGVVITGAAGQLGRELMRATWPDKVNVVGFDSTDLDITRPESVHKTMDKYMPSVIINAAAYTAVDRATSEPEAAMAVNGDAVATLAAAADGVGALLVQLSTDYVFDGTKDGWYCEEDPVAPLGVYGQSKARGEEAALGGEQSVVLRTAWVYGALGSNFITTMLRLAADRDRVAVVDDQVGCPTATKALAEAIVAVVVAAEFGSSALPRRLYHLAGPEAMSWYDFATAIFAQSSAGFEGACVPITTAEYPTPAQRPANSRLDSSLIAFDLGITLPPFRESLADVVAELEQAR